MSLKRLQSDIDKVLKKVSEGVDTFEAIFDKIQTATNANQKEKYEQDLKKEIKKLQRLRDQIKTWISSNEIKDKQALVDNRKLIETQMERFKAIEKEMKTKAFSKEGLLLKEKMDPKEKEKNDTCEWINSTVDELSKQIDRTETELERMQGSKRTKSQNKEKVSELEETRTRLKEHINKLELILRLLENDQLPTEKVLDIKEDVQYIIEHIEDADFNLEDHDFIYDDLNLSEEEEIYGIGTEDYHTGHDDEADQSHNSDDKSSDKRAKDREEESPTIVSSTVSRTPKETSHTSPKQKDTLAVSTNENTKPSAANSVKTPPASTTKPATETTPVTSSGLKYAQAAAAAAAASAATSANAQETAAKTPSSEKPVENAWVEPPKIVDQAKQNSSTSGAQRPASQSRVPSSSSAASSQTTSNATKATEQQQKQQQRSQQAVPEMNEARFPPSLADLAPAFEAIKAKGSGKGDMLYTHQMLEASLQHLPDLIDSERPKVYQPRSPYPTPSYYPQQPLSIFDNPALYEKFEMDALFFIFYYQQGTYQQYLAARELKKQSWRFHKKYLTWFQRHDEPKVITDEYEQGSYIYFDYEGAWCQRKKTDFRFEYKYLEEA